MDCKYCTRKCRRSGRQKSGIQRYYCMICKKYQQKEYLYKACAGSSDETIRSLVCESVGIRGIARVLKIAANTVLRRIRVIARNVPKPTVPWYQPGFEVDELWTFIGRKDNEYWLAYALNKATGKVVDFVIGKRTKSTLKILIDSLLASAPEKIFTDRLTIYQRLIPRMLHRSGSYCINHIERRICRYVPISSG